MRVSLRRLFVLVLWLVNWSLRAIAVNWAASFSQRCVPSFILYVQISFMSRAHRSALMGCICSSTHQHSPLNVAACCLLVINERTCRKFAPETPTINNQDTRLKINQRSFPEHPTFNFAPWNAFIHFSLLTVLQQLNGLICYNYLNIPVQTIDEPNLRSINLSKWN